MRHIEAFINPDDKIITQTRALEGICRAHDGLTGKLFIDPSLNFSADIPCLFALFEDDELAGVLTLFSPRRDEVEAVGLTHPDYRKTGIFRALVSAAAESCAAFDIADILFVCEQASASGTAAVAALGAALEYTEYSLKFDRAFPYAKLHIPEGLTLHRARLEDLDELIRISGDSFQEDSDHARQIIARVLASEGRAQYLAQLSGTPAGIVSTGYDNGATTIYGLGVTPAVQGKGIGRGILALLLQELLPEHEEDILIEVDSVNAGALHLYLSSGFIKQASFDYYRAKAGRFITADNV